jgi:hypothetical protein
LFARALITHTYPLPSHLGFGQWLATSQRMLVTAQSFYFCIHDLLASFAFLNVALGGDDDCAGLFHARMFHGCLGAIAKVFTGMDVCLAFAELVASVVGQLISPVNGAIGK